MQWRQHIPPRTKPRGRISAPPSSTPSSHAPSLPQRGQQDRGTRGRRWCWSRGALPAPEPEATAAGDHPLQHSRASAPDVRSSGSLERRQRDQLPLCVATVVWPRGAPCNLVAVVCPRRNEYNAGPAPRGALWCRAAATAIAIDCSCLSMARSRRSLRRGALPVPPPASSRAATVLPALV